MFKAHSRAINAAQAANRDVRAETCGEGASDPIRRRLAFLP
jgi:hypothetical protein